MRTARTLSREQLRELERALRSERGQLERSMARARSRRIPFGAGMLARHQELVAAIRRVEAGTYGVCSVCGTPIEYERLVQNPKATRCAECAERVTRADDPSGSNRAITQTTE